MMSTEGVVAPAELRGGDLAAQSPQPLRLSQARSGLAQAWLRPRSG
eukprot:CAMPEP_0115872988 /NCGR_PEP_ID=MMETSP0287-20121206/23737_1 /TAXON_ID=412157 /ORGANISM="Chrysochromulina rotalis, Strain UIO044" /LENGTH=45 /DNA_ID= /DNA_START= /DNA_END= /DNA_ORIENTATION=